MSPLSVRTYVLFLMKQGENVCGTTKYEVKEAK